MTPKEYANELFLQMYDNVQDTTAGMFEEDVPYIDIRFRAAKGAALIAVDEILIAIDWHQLEVPNEQIEFYEQVKSEIEKL